MIPRRALVSVPEESVARARPTEHDIERFVARFYAEVRRDPLAPILAARIGTRWPGMARDLLARARRMRLVLDRGRDQIGGKD